MVLINQQTVASFVASSAIVAVAGAFQMSSPICKGVSVTPGARVGSSSGSSLGVMVDPVVVTKKEYADICGVEFTDEEMNKRLERTAFLYPKHVEVIEDIAPIANEAVDDIVSSFITSPIHVSIILIYCVLYLTNCFFYLPSDFFNG
jgi:hypothetical protein